MVIRGIIITYHHPPESISLISQQLCITSLATFVAPSGVCSVTLRDCRTSRSESCKDRCQPCRDPWSVALSGCNIRPEALWSRGMVIVEDADLGIFK